MSDPVMVVYEKIQSLEFSLKTISGVNVVRRILDSVGTKRDDQDEDSNQEWVIAEASVRIERLILPIRVKKLLVGLVKPIYDQLDNWHNDYLFEVSPTWSPHGTIDWLRSSRALVDDPNLATPYRFMVACAFCHERRIFELAQRLTEQDLANIPNFRKAGFTRRTPNHRVSSVNVKRELSYAIVKFWKKVNRGGSFHLPERMCEGLGSALKTLNEAAVVYFLGKGDPEGIRRVLTEHVDYRSLQKWDSLSPATCCMLFSKIGDQDPKRSRLDEFAEFLLASLARWPYQSLFLDVARSLVSHASDRTFSKVLERIVCMAADGYEDFDYRGLFVGFSEIIVSRDPEWRMGQHVGIRVALAVLHTEDEIWINFVFSRYSEREKECLLLDDSCLMCSMLIIDRKFHLLEPFIRLCWENRIDVLLEINDTLLFPYDTTRAYSRGESEETFGRRLISSIVDKIVAEQKTANDVAMPRSLKPFPL